MVQSTEDTGFIATLQKEISHLRHELKTAAESHPAVSERIRVGDYLLERLAQLGVTVSLLSQSTSHPYPVSEPPFNRPSSVFQETSTSVSTPVNF